MVILVGNDPARDIVRKIVCVLIFERALYSSFASLAPAEAWAVQPVPIDTTIDNVCDKATE